MDEDIYIPRELHGKRLLGYTIGDLGITLPNILIGTYVLQFYVYTINLDSVFVSIGLTAQLIVGAFCAIIFGNIVDNKKPGKFGKRRPFLLIALPVWAVTSVIIWIPPWYCPQDNSMFLPTAIYFWSVIIIRAISRALLFNVYISMLPEQSQTLKNREKVASFRAIFSIISSVIALLMPLMVQSILPEPKNAQWWTDSGKLVLFYIPLIGLSFAIFGLIIVLIIFFSVDESFHNNNIYVEREKTSIKQAFKQMAVPARDLNFLKLVIMGFFLGFCGKIVGSLVFPFQTHLLGFTGSEFYIYIFISMGGKFGWYIVWKQVSKRRPLLKSYQWCILLAIFAAITDLVFLFGPLPYWVKITFFVITFGTVLGSMYSFPLFSIPLAASLVHEAADNLNESNSDVAMGKISGGYYGLQSFVRSFGPAMASLFVGFILSGSNKENPILIALIFFSMSFFYLIAYIILRSIKLKADSHYNHK